ncbi:MAG: dihydroorotase [Sphaerochaetaceae bacterium]
MIDIHVHLRDGKQRYKETIEHAFSVAAKCGYTTLYEMPNTDPPLTTKEAILDRIKLALISQKKWNITYGFYGGVTSDEKQLSTIVDLYNNIDQMIALKMFAGHSTGNMGLVEKKEQQKVYELLTQKNYRGVIAVHCEKESEMDHSLFDLSDAHSHQRSRPPQAEIESIKDQIELIKQTNFPGHLHICHISTQKAIELVIQAKKEGLKISCGATAHHALLDESYIQKSNHLLKMNPPLRSSQDREFVFHALLDGSIDVIESDHAPHSLEDKAKGASGIVGFRGTLILIERLREEGISEEVLFNLLGNRANEIFAQKCPITIASNEALSQMIKDIRDEYPYDPFEVIRP